MRWFPGMMGWIFGDDDGFSVYVRIGDNLKNVIISEGVQTGRSNEFSYRSRIVLCYNVITNRIL